MSNGKRRVGWVLTILVAMFLVMDSVMKLLALPVVLESGTELGFEGVAMARVLGMLLLACTILYLFPRTSLLGAVLLTGYLGGAVATHVRAGNPLFSHVLFGVYVGILVWLGLCLRDPAVQKVFPFREGQRRRNSFT